MKSTIPLTNKDKEKIKEDKIKRRKEEERKREEGVWKTSWQWLSDDWRKVEDDSYPEEKYNWIYDEASDSFEKSNKAFYYYSEYDTIQVSEEEYQQLKKLYIDKFGGWKKIDLENTNYNGKNGIDE